MKFCQYFLYEMCENLPKLILFIKIPRKKSFIQSNKFKFDHCKVKMEMKNQKYIIFELRLKYEKLVKSTLHST